MSLLSPENMLAGNPFLDAQTQADERSAGGDVEWVMSRLKIIRLCALPTLLLFVLINSMGFDGGMPGNREAVSICDGSHDNDDPAKPGTFFHSAWRWNRRVNQSGVNQLPAPATISFLCYQAVPSPALTADRRSFPDLAANWQFHWRTAAEPRAPSSLGFFARSVQP
jgi:hypothetical protein